MLQEASRPGVPSGALTPQNWTEVIGALLPEGAIVSDEANTSGLMIPMTTAGAPRHDVLTLTGGAIGQGLPVAVGAAVACPDRPVVCLQADGSAMYTASALWTMAREGLDVTTVLLNNRAYAILRMELSRVGAEAAGPKAQQLLDLSGPDLDFVSLSQGHGRAGDAGDHGRGAGRPVREGARRAGPAPDRGHGAAAALSLVFLQGE